MHIIDYTHGVSHPQHHVQPVNHKQKIQSIIVLGTAQYGEKEVLQMLLSCYVR